MVAIGASRLAATLPAAFAAPAPAKAALAKSAGALALAALVGAGAGSAITYAVMRSREPAPPPPREIRVVVIPDAGAALEIADAGVPRAEDAGLARVEPPPSREPELEPDAIERNMVERARTAIARGRFAQALETLDAHEARFENARFAEEREALAISALAGLGRRDEAALRAERFRARYPRSLFRGSIERALAPPAEGR